MHKLKITSDSLRKKLQELGLLDDDGCYSWDYDSSNNDNASYEDEVRISTDVNVDKNGIGYGDTLNCIDDEETILNQVKRLELSKKENENANE